VWPFYRKVPLEEQLERLRPTGIIPNPGVTEADLLAFATKGKLERKPFRGLVEALARDIEREPFTPITDRLWLCDYERVEDHGAYRDVLLRLERMTGHALGLANVTDHVDIEAGRAFLQFTFQGQRVHWNLQVNDDWLDPTVLHEYDTLLLQTAADLRIYSNHADYGQSALLGAFTTEQKRIFDELTGIEMPMIATQK